ncbi:MAG TPA: ribosome-associated translation inhibitor RaiA [Anaerolineales bacterium]
MAVEVEVYARNLEIADNLKNYVTKKASKLDRYLNEIEHVRVDLNYIKSARSAKDHNVAQITVRGHGALLRVEERSDDITGAFDAAIDKMQRQLDRFKGKHFHGRGDGRSASDVVPVPAETGGEEVQVVARHKTFDLIPMNEAEALEQMKLLGHDNFFIFFNIETNSINVLYHRRDGTYGLIEPKVG